MLEESASQKSKHLLNCIFHNGLTKKANKINKLDERALRIVYQDYILNFEELLGLEKNHCFSIHHQNIQTY